MLLGFDVGWSTKRKSTGIAWLDGGRVQAETIRWKWELPAGTSELRAEVIAIDAPIVPAGLPVHEARVCESALSRAGFQRRCKPGASNVPGSGQMLRQYGGSAADFLAPRLKATTRDFWITPMRPGRNLVEAFPSAFLGVRIPDSAYLRPRSTGRKKKWHWLYDQWLESGLFADCAASLDLPGSFVEVAEECRNREKQAALVCLLTAAAVRAGRFTEVGDPKGGYFLLPALDDWDAWAREALEDASSALPSLEVRSGPNP